VLLEKRSHQLGVAAEDLIEQVAALDVVCAGISQTGRRVVQKLVHRDRVEVDEGLLGRNALLVVVTLAAIQQRRHRVVLVHAGGIRCVAALGELLALVGDLFDADEQAKHHTVLHFLVGLFFVPLVTSLIIDDVTAS